MSCHLLQLFYIKNCPQDNNIKLISEFLLIADFSVTLAAAKLFRLDAEFICEDDRGLIVIALLQKNLYCLKKKNPVQLFERERVYLKAERCFVRCIACGKKLRRKLSLR